MGNFETLRAEAIKLVNQGLTVAPATGKRVLIDKWTDIDAQDFFTPQLNSYWQRATGIGLVCGKKSGITALDIDLLLSTCDKSLLEKITAKLPPILSGKSGNTDKRPTQFFQYNNEQNRKFNNIHVEILSDGSQTILPPSIHPDIKKPYIWIGTPLTQIDIDELPYLPEGFIEFLDELNDSLKPTKGEIDKTLITKAGRCKSGSHNKLSALAIALFHDNYPFDRLVKRMISEDRKINHDADYYYFECPSRPWKRKGSDAIKENATDFVEEIFKKYGPGGNKASRTQEFKEIKDAKMNNDKAPATPKSGSTKLLEKTNFDDEGNPYEQIGFYYKYTIPKKNGDITIKYSPQFKLMADHCFEQKNLCYDDTTSLKFDGKKWKWMSKNSLQNYIVESNKECYHPAHIDNFTKAIKSKCFIDALGIKQPDGLINVDNGVIEVKTGELKPHSHEYLFKYCAPVHFDKTAEAPSWNNFLLEVFQNNVELLDLAQRLFGYVLIGGRPFLHRAFVLYGNGRNGKSTFLDILKAVIGNDAYSTVSMSKLDKEFSLVNIEGKLANIVEETPTDEINAEVFKTLVGGGEIQAAHKGFDEFTFRCNARFVFACNDMPIFRDKSVGLEERLVFIPFDRYFKENERDTKIMDKLLAELPGILNWALEGVKIVLNNPQIPDYQILKVSKELYKMETNPLYHWFKEEIEVCKNTPDIAADDIYIRYVQDTEGNGNKPFSKDKFSKQFRKILISECAAQGIYYDANARNAAGSKRICQVVRFKRNVNLTGLPGHFSQLSDKKPWSYE